MSVTGGIMAGIGAAGAIGGAAIQSGAAGNAASTQANAAEQAAQLQHQDAQDALAFQKQQYETNQSNMSPWLGAGKQALGELQGQLGNLTAPFGEQFQAPTGATEQNDPGYQFRLNQGEGALTNSAAAQGSLLSGNTLAAQQRYGQDYASNEYGNVYNRAMQQFENRYNIYNSNQANKFNRLASLAGVGQTTAAQMGQQGQSAANNISNTLLTSGAQQGQQLNNAAAATASGYIGSANAWGGALGGSTNNLSQLMMMNQLFGGGGGGMSPVSFGTIPGISDAAYTS